MARKTYISSVRQESASKFLRSRTDGKILSHRQNDLSCGKKASHEQKEKSIAYLIRNSKSVARSLSQNRQRHFILRGEYV